MSAELIETRNALIGLRSRNNVNVGVHLAHKTAVLTPGVPVAETMFDPNTQPIEAIHSVSVMEWATGLPHVQQRVPFRPENMNLVIHADPSERALPFYLQPIRDHKLDLARGLFDAINAAKMPTDRINYVVLGDQEAAEKLGGPVRILPESEDPRIAGEAVAELCTRGLTFIISSFEQLPLPQTNKDNFRQTVAVKTNHQLEYQLKHTDKKIELSLGDQRSVKLWKKSEVQQANTGLSERHSRLRGRIGALGLEVAQIVQDTDSPHSFNVSQADSEIARAIKNIARR